MKNARGFSLVELMVVIAAFMLMAYVGMPAYSAWKKKHEIEAQTLKLHSDLQYARMKAYAEKAVWGVWWGDTASFTRYQIKKDSNGDEDVNDIGIDEAYFDTNGTFAVTSRNGSIDSIGFDTRGFCKNPTTLYISSDTGAPLDCVAVSRTRVKLGKCVWKGSVCSDCLPK